MEERAVDPPLEGGSEFAERKFWGGARGPPPTRAPCATPLRVFPLRPASVSLRHRRACRQRPGRARSPSSSARGDRVRARGPLAPSPSPPRAARGRAPVQLLPSAAPVRAVPLPFRTPPPPSALPARRQDL